MKKYSIFILVYLFYSAYFYSQKNKVTNLSAEFPKKDLISLLQNSINNYRLSQGVDSLEKNELLFKAAELSSQSMAKDGKASPNAGGKTPGQKLIKVGGSKKTDEVEGVVAPNKGKKQYSAKELADQLTEKWFKDKRMKVVLLQPNWVFFGFSVTPDKENKNYYVSCMLGGYDCDNTGSKKKGELKVPFNKRSKKLKELDTKVCRECEAWKDYERLHDSLTIEKGKIYLKYHDLMYLKKILKKQTDGFAVDIVQYAQYQKPGYNILDNNLLNKGLMQKVIYRDELLSKNELNKVVNNDVKVDPKVKKSKKMNSIKVLLGTFPKAIKDKYELNLMVIQDGRVCKTVLRSYLEKGSQESNTPLDMLTVPISDEAKNLSFEPKSETSLLNFLVPFEKAKSEFKTEDIKPLIDALQEPDFKIEGLYIYAYSSIEGDSVVNAKLQINRAQSIAKVLHTLNNTKVEPLIQTNDSWLLFQMEAEDGKFDTLTRMGKKKAIKTINSDPALLEELEPILARERFAQIVMDVTYDISGTKEEKFCFVKFNQALKQGNFKQAFKILDFIHGKVNTGSYSRDLWEKIDIPFEKTNIGLLMMKKYYDYIDNSKQLDEQDLAYLNKISQLDPFDNIVKFNKVYCKIKVDSAIGDAQEQVEIQTAIDGFYKTNIPKQAVDALNTEWNFKQIDYYSRLEGMEDKVSACVQRIKKFYDFKSTSWQNALKLAYVFTRFKDYEFSCSLLEQFLNNPDVDENLLFDYISIASHLPFKFCTRNFSDVLSKAKEKNPDRYCKLFGEPFMSFQVFDNPNIKKVFLEAGCGK